MFRILRYISGKKNKVQPSLAQMPRFLEFLGHDPFEDKSEYLRGKIKEYRRIHGLAQKSWPRGSGSMIFIRLILLPAVFYREVSVDFHSRDICLVHQDKTVIANERA